MIAFEAEVPMCLLVGFSIVTILSLAALGVMLIRTRNWNLLFFVAQLISLIVSFWWLFSLITVPNNHPMLTEECSWRVAIAGVWWAVSMVFMLIGIYKVLPKKKDYA